MKRRLQIIVCILLAVALFLILEKHTLEFSTDWQNRLASIPGGVFVMGSLEGNADAQPHEAQVSGFRIGRFEVTVAEFVVYLNASGTTNWPGSPQISGRSGRYSARRFQSQKPVAFVCLADAADYGRWLSEKIGGTVRLPTEEEWEYAARGGIRRARYPWGWGRPEGRACYNTDVVRRVGSFDANPFGLYDMAGNVFEWCGPATREQAPARGGSWAERDPKFLRVFHRVLFPRDYRDADVGFRVVVEEKQRP